MCNASDTPRSPVSVSFSNGSNEKVSGFHVKPKPEWSNSTTNIFSWVNFHHLIFDYSQIRGIEICISETFESTATVHAPTVVVPYNAPYFGTHVALTNLIDSSVRWSQSGTCTCNSGVRRHKLLNSDRACQHSHQYLEDTRQESKHQIKAKRLDDTSWLQPQPSKMKKGRQATQLCLQQAPHAWQTKLLVGGGGGGATEYWAIARVN